MRAQYETPGASREERPGCPPTAMAAHAALPTLQASNDCLEQRCRELRQQIPMACDPEPSGDIRAEAPIPDADVLALRSLPEMDGGQSEFLPERQPTSSRTSFRASLTADSLRSATGASAIPKTRVLQRGPLRFRHCFEIECRRRHSGRRNAGDSLDFGSDWLWKEHSGRVNGRNRLSRHTGRTSP